MLEDIVQAFVYVFAGGFFGALAQDFVKGYRRRRAERERISQELDEIDCPECDPESCLEEWKTTITTQMHFNDLIIKFRSIVLSVFIAGLGLIFNAYKNKEIFGLELMVLVSMALVFWIACFILDYFYYHQLLLGAVRHAKKFDDNEHFRKVGMYGLTKRVGLAVGLFQSKLVIWCFYLLPTMAVVGVVLLKQLGKI